MKTPPPPPATHETPAAAGVKVRIVSILSGLYFVQPLGKGHGLKAATVAANSAAHALEVYKKAANSKK